MVVALVSRIVVVPILLEVFVLQDFGAPFDDKLVKFGGGGSVLTRRT